ncbi:hypothetical protein [Thiorhodovibrio frisius]|uniref:Rap1a immunity protein domain-containing protein n=1 Tax=Thiorhodovibrio frisius TaxID=631362 RepID=H8Z7B8_9GAMM|nr:hypothetical protein [Thiorhodovibrio frisius]EIC19834.1 hypothetical protein Thi970DRAFT_03438 [Thiorhodovibrio frisius]WPL20562.1 hypothetical protein Thiofri_00661 [Thiorhodovibrio frisius]
MIKSPLITLNLLFILLITLSSRSFSLSIEDYDKERGISSDKLDVFISGLGQGYFWSNVILAADKKNTLYCQPQTLILTTEDYLAIIDKQLAKHRKNWGTDVSIEMILFLGLAATYPCPN